MKLNGMCVIHDRQCNGVCQECLGFMKQFGVEDGDVSCEV